MRQLAFARDQLRQRSAGHVFHNDVMPSVFLEGIEHADDVGMVEFAQGLRFAQKRSTSVGSSAITCRLEYLDQRRRLRERINGAVNIAHAAGIDLLDQFVPIRNQARLAHANLLWCHRAKQFRL